MSEILRYRFQQGDVLRLRHTISQVIDRADDTRLEDQMVLEGTLTVLERLTDKSARLELTTRMVEPPRLVPWQDQMTAVYHVSHRGELLAADPVPPVLPFMTFPIEPVETRRAWKSIEAVSGRPLAMSHTLARVEVLEGEREVYLVSEGKAAGEPQVEYCCVTHFALKRGWPTRRRIVITHAFEGQGANAMVIEEEAY